MALDQFQKLYSAPVWPSVSVLGRPGIAPPQAWGLKGCVLTPETALDPGWVIIQGTEVNAVTTSAPRSVECVNTAGIILPGLIDLHGHPSWNILPPWEPPKLYPNRYAWRSSAEYLSVVDAPMDKLTSEYRVRRLLARYGEIRALVGGATAIQGSHGNYSAHREPLVRLVDKGPFGIPSALSLVDPLNLEFTERNKIIQDITDKKISALYAHVGEGTDEKSRAELDTFDEWGLLTSATIIIHGTAFEGAELERVLNAGAKLVWSPQSELRLYGKTTQAATARKLGIPLGLGADWLPSGSVSLLDEMQVARRALAEQGDRISPVELVNIVTRGAAEIAGVADKLGHLSKGRPADLLVLQRHHEDPYESVCRSGRTSVELVVIDGRLVYGRDDWFVTLAPNAKVFGRSAPNATGEMLWAWGKHMRFDPGNLADPADLGHEPPFPNRLSSLRSELLDQYPQAGPIFA